VKSEFPTADFFRQLQLSPSFFPILPMEAVTSLNSFFCEARFHFRLRACSDNFSFPRIEIDFSWNRPLRSSVFGFGPFLPPFQSFPCTQNSLPENQENPAFLLESKRLLNQPFHKVSIVGNDN